jgi:putative nucleotidyltransferase with HDIG domain
MKKQVEKDKSKKKLSIPLLGPFIFLILCLIYQNNLGIPIFLFVLYGYFKYRYPDFKDYNILYIILLYLISYVTGYYIVRGGWSIFCMPFITIPMLATLLFNNLEISFILTLTTSVSIAELHSPNPSYLWLLFLTSGLFSSIYIMGARKRATIIHMGFMAGLVQFAAAVLMDKIWLFPGKNLLSLLGETKYSILLLNGIVSGIIVLGILPVFEYLFKTVTNISLLELADSHQPLLQRLIQEAPGTYYHSLVVGNLSENACQVVTGANPLLARIGAYYHDIGKLHKPEYFSENQEEKNSKHSALSASMSKLIIMNHIKEGIELAKKHKLAPLLINFISQHHGNSLVYYFYRRALEDLEEDQQIKEEGFRYPWPKPNTKETAIVLLADSVEAATRTLRYQSPATIEEVVHKIINNKFIDGQLDECDLTLKDLEKIAAVFIRTLSGIYRGRVGYPQEQERDNNRKKFPKEDSRQSERDKKNHS